MTIRERVYLCDASEEGRMVRHLRDFAEDCWRHQPIGEHGHGNIGRSSIPLARHWGVQVPDFIRWARGAMLRRAAGRDAQDG